MVAKKVRNPHRQGGQMRTKPGGYAQDLMREQLRTREEANLDLAVLAEVPADDSPDSWSPAL